MALQKKKQKRFPAFFMLQGLVFAGLVSFGFFAAPTLLPTTYHAGDQVSENTTANTIDTKDTDQENLIPEKVATHLPTPEAVKAIYMTACVVGTPSFRSDLVRIAETTEINAIVIDIKDYSGGISFASENPLFKEASMLNCGAYDMREFIELLHEKGIYVIGRITVFQDPLYTSHYPEQAVQSVSRPGEPWKDYKGLSFVSVEARPFWEYIVELSKESYALGFDELNYDYIRWPSDGPMSDVDYPAGDKAVAVERFWKYLADEMDPVGVVTSADLFGMTATNVDDLNIGQQLERALPYFDYVSPMVYPSHYPKSFLGLGNPNSDPYRVVNYSLSEAVRRTLSPQTPIQTLDGEPIMQTVVVPAHDGIATTTKQVPSGYFTKPVYDIQKIRPWLQDFDYGGDYDVEEVRAQIQATYDAGLTSWMLWAPSNRYTIDALLPTD